MSAGSVGVLGATSFVGRYVLQELVRQEASVVAVSRDACVVQTDYRMQWLQPDRLAVAAKEVDTWISLLPIDYLPALLNRIGDRAVRRLVALSTTSILTKADSPDAGERAAVAAYLQAEQAVAQWAAQRGGRLVVLRPTMIYDGVNDRNVARIAQFASRYRFFPLLGAGSGLRQPVHAEDVAAAAAAAALQPHIDADHVLALSGGEILSYAAMVSRIMRWKGVTPRLVHLSPQLFSKALALVRVLPSFRGLNFAMVQRMQCDMVFSYAPATAILGFKPRRFLAAQADSVEQSRHRLD